MGFGGLDMSLTKQSELHRRRDGRNKMVALCLVAFMALLVALSLTKLRTSGATEGFDHVVRPALEGVSE